MSKRDILVVAIGIIILIAIIAVSFLVPSQNNELKQGVAVLTDKAEYQAGEKLKVKIENYSSESLCFSSCYPYYIQRKNGEWKEYIYEECNSDNMIDNCIDPKDVKAFELTLPKLLEGPHRLAIGACVGCHLKELFKEDKSLFSNPFVIK